LHRQPSRKSRESIAGRKRKRRWYNQPSRESRESIVGRKRNRRLHRQPSRQSRESIVGRKRNRRFQEAARQPKQRQKEKQKISQAANQEGRGEHLKMKVWQNRWARQAAIDKTGKEATRLARTGQAEGQGSKVARRRISSEHETRIDMQTDSAEQRGKTNKTETDRA
jgi:hypothetical protein